MNGYKKVIIFDLDDTLVDTSDVYWRARNCFVNELKKEGFEPGNIVEVFEEIDSVYMKTLGHAPERYTESMLATYKHLLEQKNAEIKEEALSRIRACGNIILEQLPQLISGSIELLEWTSQHFKLAILTRGDEQLQRRKLNHAGISKYFDLIKVVQMKDEESFFNIISEAGFRPEDAWIIGDSIKSDINPGIKIGASSILYLYSHHSYYWRQEYGLAAAGPFYLIYKLQAAIDILKSPSSFDRIHELPEVTGN